MRRAHRRLGIRGFLLQEVIPLLLGVGSLALYLSVAGRSALVLLTGTIHTYMNERCRSCPYTSVISWSRNFRKVVLSKHLVKMSAIMSVVGIHCMVIFSWVMSSRQYCIHVS